MTTVPDAGMKRSMMEILACPIDKHHPLELFVASGGSDTISEGALYCTRCSRFYPVIEEIPIMLPDDLRDKKQETDFLARHRGSLPEKITAHANPWHL